MPRGPAKPVYVVHLTPVADPNVAAGGDDRPPDYRLKLLLKRALRELGLRCTRVADGGPPPEEPDAGPQPQAR